MLSSIFCENAEAQQQQQQQQQMATRKGAMSSRRDRAPPAPDLLEPRHHRASRGVIVPPCNRRPRASKYYTRPIFKEPADPERINESILSKKTPKTPRRTYSANPIREETPLSFIDYEDDGSDYILPASRTGYRLRTIVGNQPELVGQRDFRRRERALERRLLKPIEPEDIDCSASVVTCSNLDQLEMKRLKSYKVDRNSSDVSFLRHEVSRIVVGNVTPSPLPKPSHRRQTSNMNCKETNNEKSEESRDEIADESDRTKEGLVESNESGGLLQNMKWFSCGWECLGLDYCNASC